MRNRKEPITASDLMAQLAANPEFVAKRSAEDAERRKRTAEMREAEAPVVEDLLAAGYLVESAWDLVNTAEPYNAAIPVLLEHLSRPYPGQIREGLARALAIPAARPWCRAMMTLYVAEADEHAKDGLAVAVNVALQFVDVASTIRISEVSVIARARGS